MIVQKFIAGFNRCEDKAFLTFAKPDGVLAKEKNFTKWVGNGKRKEFDNMPTSGFKVIRTVGGGSGDIRQAYVEIKDPRGFRVEITDENFVEICKNYSVNQGLLFGEYVYSLDTVSSLKLINTNSPDYIKQLEAYNTYKLEYEIKKSKTKFSLKNLKIGSRYNVIYGGKLMDAIYLGKLPGYYTEYNFDTKSSIEHKVNEHIFVIINDSWEWHINSFDTFNANNIVKESETIGFTEEYCEKIIDSLGFVKYRRIRELMYNGQISDNSLAYKLLTNKIK